MMSDADSVFLIPQRHQYGVDDRLVLRVRRDLDNNRRLLAHLHSEVGSSNMRFQIVMGHSPCTRRSSWRNRILYRLDLAASSAATAGSSRDGRIKGSGRPPTQEMVTDAGDGR